MLNKFINLPFKVTLSHLPIMRKFSGLEHRLRRGSLKRETSNARCPIIPVAPLNVFFPLLLLLRAADAYLQVPHGRFN